MWEFDVADGTRGGNEDWWLRKGVLDGPDVVVGLECGVSTRDECVNDTAYWVLEDVMSYVLIKVCRLSS